MPQRGHPAGGTYVVFTTQGKGMVTSGFWDMSAVLWDAQTGDELRRFEGHSGWILALAISANDEILITGSADQTARVWDLRSGQERHRFEHPLSINSVAISPDGKVLACNGDKSVRLWSVETGRPLGTLGGELGRVGPVAFSPDGKQLVAGEGEGFIRLWDLAARKEVRRFLGHSEAVASLAFSPTGQKLLTSGEDGSARLWDVSTGKELRRIEQHYAYGFGGNHVAFDKTGARFATTCVPVDRIPGGELAIRVWDTEKGTELMRLIGHDVPASSVAFSPIGNALVSGSEDATTRAWDLTTGQEVRRFEGRCESTERVAFGNDGTSLITVSNHSVRHWQLSGGCDVRRIVGAVIPDQKRVYHSVWTDTHGLYVLRKADEQQPTELLDVASNRVLWKWDPSMAFPEEVAFSADATRFATIGSDGTLQLWDRHDGKRVQEFFGKFTHVAVNHHGSQVLASEQDNRICLWNVDQRDPVQRLPGHTDLIRSLAFSPNGKFAASGGYDNIVRLWDLSSGQEMHRLQGHTHGIESILFSSDGQQVITGSWDTTIRIWDVKSGTLLQTLTGHSNVVQALQLSSDGRYLLSGSYDGSARLWSLPQGNELCQLFGFSDATWAVVDRDGRFDGSSGGQVKGLHWVVDDEPVDLAQFKERYYEPGLAAKKLGVNLEPLRDVARLEKPAMFPVMTVTHADVSSSDFHVRLRNRGGGIGRVVVMVNGKEITADARDATVNPWAEQVELDLNLAGDPRIEPGKSNRIEFRAFNREGYLSSRGLELDYMPATSQAELPPEFYAVLIGVSDYRGEQIDLRFAAKDARDMAHAWQIGSERLFGRDRVHLSVLTTEESTPEDFPSRAAIVQAIQTMQRARPGDVVALFLAGHGVSQPGPDGDFYFLTADASNAELTDPAVTQQVAIGSRELTDLLRAIPAWKQVLILDTCAAGRLIEKLSESRSVPSSQIRALERLKDRTGLHVLAGCAADAVSYEASRYGQGMLTHCLLMAMRGARLRDDEFIDVSEMFAFAADTVPRLAEGIGGIQRPQIASPGGGSFDLGQITLVDRERIPLKPVRPVVVQSNFQEEQQFEDLLGLAKRVDNVLREAAARGDSTDAIFVNATDVPHGFRLLGRYRLEDQRVFVAVNLFQGARKVTHFDVMGDATNLEALVNDIVSQAKGHMIMVDENSR